MFKFKIPNTGLKQYRGLSSDQFFREVYKRNINDIKSVSGGFISEEQWVSKMEAIKEATKKTPKQVVVMESETKKYQTPEDFSKLQAKKALSGATYKGESAYKWALKNIKGPKGRFISPGGGEWLSDGKYLLGDVRFTFGNSPYEIIAEKFDEDKGKWVEVKTFDEPTEDAPIARKVGRLG